MRVQIVGVRHHSPACARLVREQILSERPQFVLIEGPSDFNGRLSELRLPHQPPLAIFTYYQDEGSYHRSFCPFCSYSPEWVALQTAEEIGAECFFMDLPSWTRPFRHVENRYHDADYSREYVAQLCRRLNLSGMDDLWDHLFEQPQDFKTLQARLASYFQNLRACSVADPSDEEREKFMAHYIAWAATQGSVMVVCGGFHKPALETLWPESPSEDPKVPVPEEGGRFGSFLVPYSYQRLDSFTGYAAGMPSPEYYRILWEEGPETAQRRAAQLMIRQLRERKLAVSSADLIACQTMTEGLARLRAHQVPSRADLLDGLASGLVKHGLSKQLPWTRREPMTADTDPVIAEMMKALRGRRQGLLHPDTPLPPLVHSVIEELEEASLMPSLGSRTVSARVGSRESRLLHRVRILDIPGFRLEKQDLGEEVWQLVRSSDFESALIEAGAYGADLEEASLAKLEDRCRGDELSIQEIAALVTEAYYAGLSQLTSRLRSRLQKRCSEETDLAALGQAGSTLLALWRQLPQAAVTALLTTLVERGLWLVELAGGAHLPVNMKEVRAFATLRDCYRLLELDPSPLLDLMTRRSREPSAPCAHRGAAIGILWSFQREGDLLKLTLLSLQDCSHPARLGDYLAGLFGLAREEVASEQKLLAAIDQQLQSYDERDFLIALPPLRSAFSFFPPREREQIASLVLKLHGHSAQGGWALVAECHDPVQLARTQARESKLEQLLERYSLS